MAADLKLVLIGAGWIGSYHLAALGRLGRTRLVGVASARLERAEEVAFPHGAVASADPERLLDELRPDVAWLCVPPGAAPPLAESLARRGIPFLAEKPLAATDADAPRRVAALIAERRLVVAVGYHLRGLEALPELRERLAERPAQTVAGRWLDSTPAPAWWRRVDRGGGQVVEQATHLYDLGRHLVGEATVVGRGVRSRRAAGPGGRGRRRRHRGDPPVRDRGDRHVRQQPPVRHPEHRAGARRRRAPGGRRQGRRRAGRLGDHDRRRRDRPGRCRPVATRTRSRRSGSSTPSRRATRTPCLSSYGDAVRTDELTRAVVAATGEPG